MLSQFHPVSNQGCQCLPQCIVTNSSLVSFEGYKCLTCLWISRIGGGGEVDVRRVGVGCVLPLGP